MPEPIERDDLEIYEDRDEHVDADEHRATLRKPSPKPRPPADEEHEPDVVDEFSYGEESGEDYDKPEEG